MYQTWNNLIPNLSWPCCEDDEACDDVAVTQLEQASTYHEADNSVADVQLEQATESVEAEDVVADVWPDQAETEIDDADVELEHTTGEDNDGEVNFLGVP